MSRQVIIDKLNIRLPKGWQGDPNLLARRLAEQIQQQAAELQSSQQLDLSLRGHFSGNAKQVAGQFSEQLTTQHPQIRSRRRSR